MTTQISSFVHGAYVNDPSASVFQNINPATGKVICSVEAATPVTLDAAIQSSLRAFKVWSKMPAIERSRRLLKAVEILRNRNDELALIEVEDTGKPWSEASTVDVVTGADSIEYFAGLAPTQVGTQQALGNDFFYTRQEPLGVVAGIGAWNYPLQIACWKAAPALAAGNVMIFKPSEETPRGALKLAEIFIEAGIPEGVFNVVQGDGKVGEWLTQHPNIAKVSFTGEVNTGCKVMAASSKTLKAVTMELGGKSPLIIFDDADLEQAVIASMLANFYTQGEVCTHGTRVFVQNGIYQRFVEQLQDSIKTLKVGDPLNPDTHIGALISSSHMEKVLDYIRIGVEEGAHLLSGGRRVDHFECKNGYFVEPTVFTHCSDDMRICQEEIFGPVMNILCFDSEEEVIKRANNTGFGLAAGVFTQNIQKGHRVIHQIEAGICWINQYGASPAEMPVGGYKMSGVGRENGLETLGHYTQTKSIYVGIDPIESPYI